MFQRLRVRPLAPVAQVHLEDGAVAPRALGPVQDAGLGLQGLLELLLRGGLRRRAPHREARARVAAAVDAEVAHVQLEHAALDEAEGLDAVQRAPVLVHDEVVDARACAGREEEPAAGRGHYGGGALRLLVASCYAATLLMSYVTASASHLCSELLARFAHAAGKYLLVSYRTLVAFGVRTTRGWVQ